jgi:hypothetical protein
MHTMRDDNTRKTILIAVFFAGSLAALLWLLSDVAGYVASVLHALGR